MADREDEELVELESQEELERAQDPIAEKDKRIEELTSTLKRLQAEFENYKKRVAKDWVDMSKIASESVVYDLLAILDTFDKALGDNGKGQDAKTLHKGLENIQRQLMQTLQRHGLKEIRTDVKFDPFEHEATMRQEMDGCEDGTILEVFQKGYLLGPKVIRTAKVKVSKARELDEDHDTLDNENPQECERGE